MPADHLRPEDQPDPSPLESAVAAVLAGTSVEQATTISGTTPERLRAAVAAYRAAGRAALQDVAMIATAAEPWISITLTTPERGLAEQHAATVLLPALGDAEADGALASWWFVRKSPEWRWRLQPQPHRADDLSRDLASTLDTLAAEHFDITWQRRHYEPETLAFGGAAGMDVAHQFFHADSRAVLDHLRHRHSRRDAAPRFGDREASLLICTTLLRSAGLDWHEQGDVWARVTQLRPPAAGDRNVRPAATDLVDKVGRYLQLDTRALLHDAHAREIGPWLAAADRAGASLQTLAAAGGLRRGLRAVLALHVIFHWNRLGLPATTQAVLADAATTATLGPHADPHRDLAEYWGPR